MFQLISYKDSQVNTGAIHTTATESSRNNEENPRNVLCNQFHEILQQTNQYTNLQVSDVNTWLQCPSLMLPDECLTDKEIVELIKDDQIDEAKVDKENASLSQSETQDIPNAIVGLNNNVTIFQACKALNAVIDYCKNSRYEEENIVSLNHVKERMTAELHQLQLHVT